MLINTHSHAHQRAVYAPCALSNHHSTPSTSAPVGWTRPVPLERAGRRPEAEAEAERLAKVLETRADVAARLRAAADRRAAERLAKQAEKDAAKQRRIVEREAQAGWWEGIREKYRGQLTTEALKIARAQRRAREKTAEADQ